MINKEDANSSKVTTMEVFERLKDDPNYTRKQVKLSDGRILSYSEAGDLSPQGVPVIFCEGLMVSSLVVLTFHEEALARHLRIIAIDYPGIGDSTPVPNRTVEDWALDVEQCCDIILSRSTRFYLACHSMGGPHALAILSSPNLQDRITSATLVSPWLPFDDEADTNIDGGGNNNNNNNNPNKWFLNASRRYMPSFVSQTIVPKIVTAAASTSLAMVGSMPSSAPPDLALAKHITDYAAKQGQGGNQQMVQLALNGKLVIPNTTSSSNMLTKKKIPPVTVFVGTKDNLVSEASCQLLIDKLKENCGGGQEDVVQASLKIIEGADHNTIMAEENLPTILATFDRSFDDECSS